ncbi:hypothetical protein RhiirB3_533048 [Rhizophagus irregularis]|nr:hypothetical protein RhiirB3_533048 [Rhizophagus irregularis]
MNAGACRIWIEDSNHKRIAGDGKGDYHACDGTSGDYKEIDFPDQEYYVVAKVHFTLRKQKVRGSFNGNTCFPIISSVLQYIEDLNYFYKYLCKSQNVAIS